MEDSLGTKFLSKAEIIETSPLKENYITCLYISSKWCPLCITFTPILIDFYNEINIEEKLLEIIYVSRDKTKDEFEEFYKEMPWLALPYGDSRVKKLIEAHDVKGIPILIILKKNGEAATVNGKKDIMNEGYEVFQKWLSIVGKKNE